MHPLIPGSDSSKNPKNSVRNGEMQEKAQGCLVFSPMPFGTAMHRTPTTPHEAGGTPACPVRTKDIGPQAVLQPQLVCQVSFLGTSSPFQHRHGLAAACPCPSRLGGHREH